MEVCVEPSKLNHPVAVLEQMVGIKVSGVVPHWCYVGRYLGVSIFRSIAVISMSNRRERVLSTTSSSRKIPALEKVGLDLGVVCPVRIDFDVWRSLRSQFRLRGRVDVAQGEEDIGIAVVAV